MRKKVADLTGPELDYFVAKARGWEEEKIPHPKGGKCTGWRFDGNNWIDVKDYTPHNNGAQWSELIEKFGVGLRLWNRSWKAQVFLSKQMEGSTAGIAVCRAVVASKFGEYVEVSGV